MIRGIITVLAVTFLAVVTWTFLWPEKNLQTVPEVGAILCLGAGVDRAGRIDAAAETRTRTCVDLYLAGKAPLVIMTSGAMPGAEVPGSIAMVALAVDLGVPPNAIRQDSRAQSTLQNMLFSRQLVPNAESVIVVTEAFHLPRSWASARWAGFEEVTLVASEPIRADADFAARMSLLGREALAIWFNLGRATAYGLAGLKSVPEETRLKWLQ